MTINVYSLGFIVTEFILYEQRECIFLSFDPLVSTKPSSGLNRHRIESQDGRDLVKGQEFHDFSVISRSVI